MTARSSRVRTRTADRGSVSLELVVLIPGLVLLLGLTLAGGRVRFARGAVEDAAYSAARGASLARNAAQARTDGRADGLAALRSEELECGQQSVDVDTAGFAVPVGTPASVGAQVSCTVDLADVVVPGLPGSMRLRATATAPLDTYRAR